MATLNSVITDKIPVNYGLDLGNLTRESKEDEKWIIEPFEHPGDRRLLIDTYFDQVMKDVAKEVSGSKIVTLDSNMINMGKPQAFCMGLPENVADFASKYVSENLFIKELKNYEDLSVEDEKEVMKIHKNFKAIEVK